MKKLHPALVRSRVRKLLRDCRVRKPPVAVQAIARALGAQIRYEPFEGEISGILYQDKDNIIIGVNSLHHPNRQRFTIAHEIGHLILHNMNMHVDKGYRITLRDTGSSLAVDPAEIQANQFAAELLMPEHMLARDTPRFLSDFENEGGLQKLARRYRVSTQALAFRLANLGLIKTTQ